MTSEARGAVRPAGESSEPVTRPVFAITPRPGQTSAWTQVGVATVERDRSISIKLSLLPLSGELVMRPLPRSEGSDR